MVGGTHPQTSIQNPFIFQADYLRPTQHARQPFCGNLEGWGPLSPYRYDFTPCFLDVWIALVAAWGIVAGAGAIWYLLKTGTPEPVKKNWHFYAKLVCSSLSLYHLGSWMLTLPG